MELMLSFFQASGHNLYEKRAHIYLQDMRQLELLMVSNEFLTTKSNLTIRSSEKYWVGLWSDMAIEQVLMRWMKCIGNLTHNTNNITSINSGVVTDSSINCYKTQEIDIALQLAMSSQKISEFKFKKSTKVTYIRMVSSTLKSFSLNKICRTLS